MGRRRKRLALLLAVVLVAVGVWYFAIRTPEPTDDLGRFQGEWQVVVSEVDRQNKPTGRAVPVTVRVTGDRWVYVANGKEGGRFALALRPDADPKEIDLVMLGPDDRPNGMVTRGIYTVSRDRAEVVYAPGDRPTGRDDPNAMVWLLERVK